MAETLNTRVTRLERAMAALAEGQVRMQRAQLKMQKDHARMQKDQARMQKDQAKMQKAQLRMDNALAHLAEVQTRDEDAIRQMKMEALEREKRLDERIEKLVSAIGELIRHRNGKR
jgi:exonuclease VII small subunit